MDQTSPAILLDLDGVLNPLAALVCPDGYQERVFFEGEGLDRYCVAHAVWWAVALRRRTRRLACSMMARMYTRVAVSVTVSVKSAASCASARRGSGDEQSSAA